MVGTIVFNRKENSIEWLRKDHSGWKELNGIGACVSTVRERGETTTVMIYSIIQPERLGAKEDGKSKRSLRGIASKRKKKKEKERNAAVIWITFKKCLKD